MSDFPIFYFHSVFFLLLPSSLSPARAIHPSPLQKQN